MEKDKRDATEAVDLRSLAEELLAAKTTQARLPLTDAESSSLIHELEVHQIELEMQNAEIRQNRDNVETALEMYSDLYDFAPVGYFTVDLDGNIRKANLTGAALVDTERSRLIGRNFRLFVADEARSLFTAFLGKVFANGGKESCEVTLKVKKEAPLFVRIDAVAGKSGGECRLAAVDISEQRRAEENLRHRDRFIMQQSRHAAMGAMLGSIAHHWRQPLNAIGLIIQEMAFACENGCLSKDHAKTSAGDAMRIIFSLSQTLDRFRNLFTPDSGKSRFMVNQVIASAVSFIEENFKEERIAIYVNNNDEPIINGYPHEYSQVLLNILFNARDALCEMRNGSARVTVSSFSEEGKAVVTITDNAGGIDKDNMERIFEPYFSTKEPGKGTGIGLFMAKSVIENQMGGRLIARNVEGGAEFKIEV